MTENNHKNPKISVIIPLYNKRDYIGRTLDSVLAQTIQEFEVVVVDDGSTDDGGEEVVKSYTDPRIRLVRQKNRGVSSARNHGVSEAQSDFVAFLDADDEWFPEFLETILQLRDKCPEAGLYGTSWFWDVGDEKKVHNPSTLSYEFEGYVPSPLQCAALDGIFPNCTSSTAIPKNIFVQLHGFREDSRMGEDLDLWARIALFYPHAYSSKPLVHYHSDDEHSAVRNPALSLLREYPFQKSLREYADSGVLNPTAYSYDLRLYLNSLNLGLASANFLAGNQYEARNYLKLVTFDELKPKKRFIYFTSLIPDWIRPLARIIWKVKEKAFLGR